MDDLRLVERSAESWQHIAETLKERLDESVAWNKTNNSRIDLYEQEVRKRDTTIDKLLTERNVLIAETKSAAYQKFLETQAIAEETELEEFSGLKVQVLKMTPRELFNSEIKRLVKDIDSISKRIYNMQESENYIIEKGNLVAARGEQPLQEIAEKELRERIKAIKKKG